LLEEVVKVADVPVVIDAEALQRDLLSRLRERQEMGGKVVLTPHMGEYSRISGNDFEKTGEAGLLRFCREERVHTVLKGPPFSRISDGEKISYILPGGPVLARGGSGDLLSGILGSLAARDPSDLWGAARKATLWHGLAAEALARRFGHEAVRTTQILDFLPGVLRREA
jgi:ADP-dependent NAD(P)H-hydrate dehydratase / NAD(P)H-hydrate epimerase